MVLMMVMVVMAAIMVVMNGRKYVCIYIHIYIYLSIFFSQDVYFRPRSQTNYC